MDEVARSVVDVIKDTLVLLLESCADVPDSQETSNLGAALLDRLEGAVRFIGVNDIRYDSSGDMTLIDELENFHRSYEMLGEQNASRNRICLKHFETHKKSLQKTLNLAWNSSLPRRNSSSAAANRADDIEMKTPEKKENIVVFEKFTPLIEDKSKVKCPYCDLLFVRRSLENHIQNKHKEEDASNPTPREKFSEPVGRCKLPDKKDPTMRCDRQFPSFQIKRHLKEFHNHDCPGPKESLRGFKSDDGGATWKPVFLRKADPDPTFDIIIQEVENSEEGEDIDDDREDRENAAEGGEEKEVSIVIVEPEQKKNNRGKKRLFSAGEGSRCEQEEETQTGVTEEDLVEGGFDLQEEQTESIFGEEDHDEEGRHEQEKEIGASSEDVGEDVCVSRVEPEPEKKGGRKRLSSQTPGEDGNEDDVSRATDSPSYEVEETDPKITNFNDKKKKETLDISLMVDLSNKESSQYSDPILLSNEDVSMSQDLNFNDKKEMMDISLMVDLSNEEYSDPILSSKEDVSLSQDLVFENLSSNSQPEEVDDNVCKDMNSNRMVKFVFVAEAVDQMNDLSEEIDSDWENGDSPEFTRQRMARKAERQEARNYISTSNLLENDGNIDFISRYKNYIANRKLCGISSKGKKKEENDKYFGHLFKYNDSFLSYESAKNPDFNLNRLISFQEEDFLHLASPLDWIKETCPNYPSRAEEKLKSHSVFREFIQSCVENVNFGGSIEGMLKRTLILDGLARITKDIASRSIYADLKQAIRVETTEKRHAKLTLNPSEAHNVANAVLKWNTSEEGKAKELEFKKIYEDSMDSRTMKSRPFTQLGHFVKFKCCITDKNRPGSYQLLNLDVSSCKKQYWPENYSGFGQLPSGWDPNVQPSPEAKPSAYIIFIPGSRPNMKMKRDVTVTLIPSVKEWFEMYRDCKELLIPDMKDEDPFFINFNNQELSDSRDVAIWNLFQKVTGVSRANVTQIRKGAEMNIRTDPEMTAQVDLLNNHSNAVGEAVYNIGSYQTRAEFVNAQAVAEGSSSQLPEASGVDSDRRKMREEEDDRKKLMKAQEILKRDKRRRNDTLSSQMKLKPSQREYLQKLISENSNLEIYEATRKKFPGDVKWKVVFNRFLDSADLSTEDRDKVKIIEQEIFLNIKPHVEKEHVTWDGGRESNRLADFKVAQSVKKSFLNYENDRERRDPKYFKF